MGQVHLKSRWDTETVESFSEPTFDPLYGFPNGRKKREMLVTEEEMRLAKVPPMHRDYCAHKYIEFWDCKKQQFPFLLRCNPVKHGYEQCQYDDYVLRLKEFEREKRLRARQKRKQQSMIAA